MFIINKDLYCYKVIHFGLKNTEATYQRLINKIFKDQIGHDMEIYINDILVKSIEATLYIDDLAEAFDTLRKY